MFMKYIKLSIEHVRCKILCCHAVPREHGETISSSREAWTQTDTD